MHRSLPSAVASAVVLALAAAPAAQASSAPVCNQASPHFQGGGLVALDAPVDSPAARYTTNLSALPGSGQGLGTAAARSPALTACGAPVLLGGGGFSGGGFDAT